MGLFDEIHISAEIREQWNMYCPKCSDSMSDKFQTKDLECVMLEYILKPDARLYRLDPPDDKYFTTYTQDEIDVYNAALGDNPRMTWFRRKLGDRYYTSEAFLVENRRQRNMGELSHQFVVAYSDCTACQTLVDFELKFTDGILVSVRTLKDYK